MTAAAPRAVGGPAPDYAFLTNVDDATELILVRHGQQEIDHATAMVRELVDPPLSERGRIQARLVGERFRSQRIDAVYASGLQRARDTGAQIAEHHGLTPIIDDELREIEIFRDAPPERTPLDIFGRDRLIGFRNRMAREQTWDVYPLSESSFEFRKRVCNSIESILAANRGKRVVVACHGGVINTYIGSLIGLDRDMWFRPAHTAVNVVKARDHVRAVDFINDIHHLRAYEGDVISW